MGLGPPVCVHCRVVYELNERGWPQGRAWRCPSCLSVETDKFLWMLTAQEQREYLENSPQLGR